MKTYTTEEIKEWLNGLKFVDCYGNPFAVDVELNGAIDSFIKEIDDKESGIEAVMRRIKHYQSNDVT